MVATVTSGVTDQLFRAMRRNSEGRPLCGTGDSMLGARVPIDVKPDPAGHVTPGKGGMSVTPDDPGRLPPHYRPIRLGGLGRLPVFQMAVSDLGGGLSYRPDAKKPDRHGFVEPASPMPLDEYQAHLAETKRAWREYR